MKRVPDSTVRRDIVTVFAESEHRSPRAFAAELGVSEERVQYWLALAELKRRGYAEGGRCD